jgi:hypothetical protein
MVNSVQTWQARAQKIQSEFQQLGQDLQAGNLTQAQSDYTTLSSNLSGSQQNNSTLSQAFSALGSALQGGSLSAAQQAYSALQQDVQQTGHGHHHHHRAESSSDSTSSSGSSSLTQLFGSLGTALLGGNLSAAQTAYSTLSQGLSSLSGSSGASTVAGILNYLV